MFRNELRFSDGSTGSECVFKHSRLCLQAQSREGERSETELSAILLSFIECEVEQEKCTAVSSPARGEADEEQEEGSEEEEGGKGKPEETAPLCDVR